MSKDPTGRDYRMPYVDSTPRLAPEAVAAAQQDIERRQAASTAPVGKSTSPNPLTKETALEALKRASTPEEWAAYQERLEVSRLSKLARNIK